MAMAAARTWWLLVALALLGGAALAQTAGPGKADPAVLLDVTNVFTFPDTTGISLTATAGARDVRLNDAGGLTLVDDLGNRHRLVPPPGNPQAAVPAGQTQRFDLEFIGPVSRRATTLFLTTNTGHPPGDPTLPVVTLSIPVAGLHD